MYQDLHRKCRAMALLLNLLFGVFVSVSVGVCLSSVITVVGDPVTDGNSIRSPPLLPTFKQVSVSKLSVSFLPHRSDIVRQSNPNKKETDSLIKD